MDSICWDFLLRTIAIGESAEDIQSACVLLLTDWRWLFLFFWFLFYRNTWARSHFFLLALLWTCFWWWRLFLLGLARSGLGNFLPRWCCARWLWRGDWRWLGGLLAGLPRSWSGNLFGFRNRGRGVPFFALFLDGLSRRRFTIAFLGGRVLSC